jgi:DNA mismatch repair protein MSH6
MSNLFYFENRNDAIIGNQEFGMKITQRVNMPMVGFPEASLIKFSRNFTSKVK